MRSSPPKKAKETKKEPSKPDTVPKEADKLLTITDIPQVDEEVQPPASVSEPILLHHQTNPRADRYAQSSEEEIASLVQDQEDILLELPDEAEEAPFARKSPGAQKKQKTAKPDRPPVDPADEVWGNESSEGLGPGGQEDPGVLVQDFGDSDGEPQIKGRDQKRAGDLRQGM